MNEIQKIKMLAEMDITIKRQESILKKMKQDRADLEKEILDNEIFENYGIGSFAFDDLKHTVFLSEKWYAKLKQGVERHQAADMLVIAGLGDLVKLDFNLNSVTSRFKEEFLTKEGEVYDFNDREFEKLSPGFEFKNIPRIVTRKK